MLKEKYIRLIKCCLIILFLIFTGIDSKFPATPVLNINQYIEDEWKENDGLPHNSVKTVTQTPDGYIWFGTTNGLARFDGIEFKLFNSQNTPQFRVNRIICLFADYDGSLWIGTEGGGLLHYKDRQFTLCTTENGLFSNYITEIYRDSQGVFWIGTPDKSLLSYKNNKLKIWGPESGLTNENIQSLHEDNTGALWVGTFGGLFKLRNNKFERIDPDKNFIGSIVSSIHQDRKGLIYIGSNKGLTVIENNQFRTISKENSLLSNDITSINDDRMGNIWIGTSNGLQVFSPYQSGTFKSEIILEKISIPCIFVDSENSIWAATYGDGVKRFREGKFLKYTSDQGLSHNLPISLFEDSKGRLLVGLKNGKINILNPEENRFYPYLEEEISSDEEIRAICQDREGNIWISFHGEGILSYSPSGKIRKYTEKDGLISNVVRTLFIDSGGKLWIGTRFGLSVFTMGKFNNYTVNHGLPSNIILCLNEDSKGRLWVGTGKGPAYFIDGRFESFPLKEESAGLPILTIFPDENNVIWLGTEGGGIIRIKEETSAAINTSNGLPTGIICNILEDSRHFLWLATDKGLLQIEKQELNQVFEGIKREINFKFYDTSDGLPSNECVKWSQYSALKRIDGSLWFATIDGLCIIDPDNIIINKNPPPVKIERIFIDGKETDYPLESTVLSVKDNIIFKFTAITFISPYKVKYRYKLENYDSEWKEILPGPNRSLSFKNLKPGQYTFFITACNRDGIWNLKGDAVSFKIKGEFSGSPYSYFLFIFLVSLAGGAFYLLRAKKTLFFSSKKYKSSTLSPEKKEQYQKKIITALEKEKVYREENITLSKISDLLSIPLHHLSQVINEKLQKNFNELINSYRIEEAKKKLIESDKKENSILEIAYDVGFNSKTVFNRAFKKYTGMTPSQFRKQFSKKDS